MSEPKTWYLFVRGRQEGPMSREELAERLQSEERSSDVLVLSSKPSESGRASSYFDRAARETASDRPAQEGRSQEVAYTIHGDDLQFVEIWLEPGDAVIAEPGSMMYMESDVRFEARSGEISPSEEGLPALAWFTNIGDGKRKAAFAAPHPGKILQIDLQQCDGEFYCRRSSFLCAAKETKMEITLDKGFLLQRLGGDGSAFIHACGALFSKNLKPEETLRVSADCILGFSKEVDCDIVPVAEPASTISSGEELFWADLTGPGKVWLQSLPFSRLAERINAAAPPPAQADEA